MTSTEKNPDWIYVVVQAPGENDMFLGQHDDEKDISFIPVFHLKEDALQCLPLMKRDRSLKYEVQAVHREEISEQAAKTGFLLYFLDENGAIQERIEPTKGLPGR